MFLGSFLTAGEMDHGLKPQLRFTSLSSLEQHIHVAHIYRKNINESISRLRARLHKNKQERLKSIKGRFGGILSRTSH